MADTKISALTAVATPALTDEYATNQGAVSKRTTLSQVRNYFMGHPKVFSSATFVVPTNWEWECASRLTLASTARAIFEGTCDVILYDGAVRTNRLVLAGRG